MRAEISFLSNVSNEILEYRPIIQFSHPILSNPDSYKNIHQILKQLQIFAIICIVREWVFIGCDGPPYCLTSRIVESSPDESDFA